MIESVQNKNVKLIKALGNKKDRNKYGFFVVEGLRSVSEIPFDYNVEFFAVAESFVMENNISVFEEKAEVIVLTDKLFKEISYTETPQGILAVIKQKEYELKIEDKGFYVLAENLNDPGNLGTIIRTAHASGCNGIFLSKGCVDVYSPKVLRSTMGSIFHLPIYKDMDLKQVSQLLKENNISIYAAHLKGEKTPYELSLKEGCSFLVGNEATGLTDEGARLATQLIKIPMPGNAESLNVSIAAGILMYEVVRQRL
ncbi:MAG: TrmH family RNA methyltransferase [Anaerotignaceae bacterium]